METCEAAGKMARSEKMQHGQAEILAVSPEVVQPITTSSTLCVDVPFVHYKQTARVQEVELPVEVTRVHVENVEVQAPHEIPIIHPRELGIHQQTRRNVPTPLDVFTVQKYQLPRLRPKYYDVEVPIYVPRYVEVPVPSHFVAYTNEALPDTLSLGPSMQSTVMSAPVLANNQDYSLAQRSADAAQHASQGREGAEESKSPLNPPLVLHMPEKEGKCPSDLMCFFPSSAPTGLYRSSSSWPSMGPTFFLTPSHKHKPAAPLNGPAVLQQQKAQATVHAVQQSSDSNALEMPNVAGIRGLASVGRASSSSSISASSTDREGSIICSPSLVSANTEEIIGPEVQHSRGGEQLHEAVVAM